MRQKCSIWYKTKIAISVKELQQDRYLLQILLAASKKAITRKWLNEEPPTVSDWMEIIHEMANLLFETIFRKIWTILEEMEMFSQRNDCRLQCYFFVTFVLIRYLFVYI